MNTLPRIFCVTLKDTPLRTKAFQELAEKAGLSVTIYHGILGRQLGLVPKFPNELECPGGEITINDGTLGCYMSHFLLWKILQYLPEDEFLIFEDDAVIKEDFVEKFQAAYNDLPKDWQLAYVGWVTYGKDITPMPITDKVSVRIPSATHAYLVKKSVLEELCQMVQPAQSPIDLTLIHRVLTKIRYYVFDPPLVEQQSYLNTENPIWTSLVYDWENDLYKCKQKFIDSISLNEEGWHSLERNDHEQWQWSKDKFTITLPTQIDAIKLFFTSPLSNRLTIWAGENKLVQPVSVGNNELTIELKGNELLEGEVEMPFIPSEQDSESRDSRRLGICLKEIILVSGGADIIVDLKRITA